jgi:serine/threonine protein kinase
MGNCNFKTEYENDNVAGNFDVLMLILKIAMTKNHFQFHYVIGRGGFGKVWKVEKKKEKKLYAMKEMHKGRIIQKRSVNSVMNEKKFLTQLKHP